MNKPKEPMINDHPTIKPSCSPYLVCDSCGAYPLEPVHGHYVCPRCKMPTKCCEGGPLDE